jgi:hypothetical protein
MPKLLDDRLSSPADKLAPFEFHGLGLDRSREQAAGDCPFCRREGKFFVSTATGQWDCKVCGERGNVWTFLRALHKISDEKTGNEDVDALAAERGLLHPETLLAWGACRSALTGDWLLPGWGADGKLCQLYRWVGGGGRMRLLPTPGLGHRLFGVAGLDSGKPEVLVCEGPWDGMALWEALRVAKDTGKGLRHTAAEGSSLLAGRGVVAVPSCSVFAESWLPLFAGKRAILLYDSDHPREANGKTIDPAGWAGMRRAAGLLAGVAKEVHCVTWGSDGYDPNKKSGWDVRDALTAGKTPAERVARLEELLALVKPVPEGWLKAAARAGGGGGELECLPCRDWRTLTDSWRKALSWTPGLGRALAVMLASVTSTESVGDQLWVKIVGPPSSGKTILCEALSVARRYVYPKDTMTGLFSGYQTDRDGSEDLGMVLKLKNKTLVIKDGDTVLQLPNKDQILSQYRAFYDRAVRTQYRNRMSRDYEDINTTFILCGTESLRTLDSSELGERLLDCVICDRLDPELEDAIALRKLRQAERELVLRADGKPETRDGPEMVEAKRLTGGYVIWLRENAQDLLSGLEDIDDSVAARLVALGTFVAFMRSRPSKRQEETAQRELSFRLVSQHLRLAKCLAVVLNRRGVDGAVMDLVRAVALDTARGRTLELVKRMRRAGEAGAETRALAASTGQSEDKERGLLRFLSRIGAIESFRPVIANVRAAPRWRLTRRMETLCRKVESDAKD